MADHHIKVELDILVSDEQLQRLRYGRSTRWTRKVLRALGAKELISTAIYSGQPVVVSRKAGQ